MGTSNIDFGGRSVDANDAAMEVWLRLLVAAIDDLHEPPGWLLEARRDWNDAATLGFGFGVIPELDAFIMDEARRRIVLELCAAARSRLDALADPIPKDVLNALGAGPPDSTFTGDVPAEVFREVAEGLTALIRDTPLGPRGEP